MSNTIRFTKLAIEKLKAPSDKDRIYYKDKEIKSLEIAVYKSGKKVFYLYKRIGDTPSRLKLGSYPDLTVENARKEAQKKLGEIVTGIDPQDAKRKSRQEITLNEMFEIYFAKYASKHNKSADYTRYRFNFHLKDTLGKYKLSSLTSEKIGQFHSKLGSEVGGSNANRTLNIISAIFGKAIDWGYYDSLNPCKRVKRFKTKSRERFITPDEMPKFLKALDQELNETAKDYIFMSLLTGARKANVLSMKWDELDLELKNPLWSIPGKKTKNSEDTVIPISPPALEILNKRKKQNDKSESPSEYVFPGKGRKGFLNDPVKAWRRVLDQAKIKDLRIHDLRRTFGSWLAASGANSFMIGKALGHKSIKSTAIYARLSLDPMVQSINIATNSMIKAGKERE